MKTDARTITSTLRRSGLIGPMVTIRTEYVHGEGYRVHLPRATGQRFNHPVGVAAFQRLLAREIDARYAEAAITFRPTQRGHFEVTIVPTGPASAGESA